MPAPSILSVVPRKTAIAFGVLLLHVALLWALQSGLMQRAVEIIVPAQVLSEFISPPAPRHEAAPTPARPAVPQPQKTAQATPTPVTAPQPLAVTTPPPVTSSPVMAATAPSSTSAVPSPASPTVSAPTTPAPAKVELPSTNAAYLNNPKPAYPALSKRLGEEGKVVVRVLIGVDGTAQQAELHISSGYERLDQAALATVRSWRYVPGKRGGVPEAMWFNVPISFVLE